MKTSMVTGFYRSATWWLVKKTGLAFIPEMAGKRTFERLMILTGLKFEILAWAIPGRI